MTDQPMLPHECEPVRWRGEKIGWQCWCGRVVKEVPRTGSKLAEDAPGAGGHTQE